jgi:hypothetical protein
VSATDFRFCWGRLHLEVQARLKVQAQLDWFLVALIPTITTRSRTRLILNKQKQASK